MVRFSPFKPEETPAPPEVAVAEQKALESMQEIERALEQVETSTEQPVEKPAEVIPVSDAPVLTQVTPVAPVRTMDPLAEKIEKILEEDLTDLYLKMTPPQQQAFKAKGEETATKIRQLLAQTKVNAKKIFGLLREWLKLIPGVNRFFLEQEAKIKTDKILFANEQEKKM